MVKINQMILVELRIKFHVYLMQNNKVQSIEIGFLDSMRTECLQKLWIRNDLNSVVESND